jgi:hypothetical protein
MRLAIEPFTEILQLHRPPAFERILAVAKTGVQLVDFALQTGSIGTTPDHLLQPFLILVLVE